MGSMMKGEEDLLTIKIQGDGPIEGLTVTADSKGNVKGYAHNPVVILPANSQGKLDVGGVIGAGVLQVMKDMGLKEPYASTVDLQTGEIGDDLTYYFAASEQVPSVVALGVLMNRDNTVRQAGGFIVQLMPFTSEEVIVRLEEKLTKITSVTELLEAGKTPEALLETVLGEFGLEITDRMPAGFRCDCSRERVEKALVSLGKKELQDMIDDGEGITVNCHFCNKDYNFDEAYLKKLREAMN